MAKMRAMVVREAKGRLVEEERDIPDPGVGEIRLRVEACGVCHSDVLTVEGLFQVFNTPVFPATR
jgi:D-arabinose 1-dehydrogenase-like Zn-dependent alcohol dehydrogenase